jgi:hypothetical protein
MARLESVAVAGYYPTPQSIIPLLVKLFDVEQRTTEERGYRETTEPTFLDPCAGDGEAVMSLIAALYGENNPPRAYTVEMELTRYEALRKRFTGQLWNSSTSALRGDAFRVQFAKKDKDGISLLYLNPPYDLDPQWKRLEEKFLVRFTPTLMLGGVLVLLVPFYALAASATTLAREYTDLQCFRFPEPEWQGYRQVALVAKKDNPRMEPDPAIIEKVTRWASDETSIPVLTGDIAEKVKIPNGKPYRAGLAEWSMKAVDTTVLLQKISPWKQTDRSGKVIPTSGVLPEIPIQDLLLRKYPVATPPRPAHIAAGIASGIFNGSRVEPNKKGKLPSLLVKGVFDREYKTIEEKKNKDGEVKGFIQIQQPKLVTTVLDLSTHKYHVLKAGVDTSKRVPAVEDMTTSDLLKHYGDSLMEVMERQCPITYDPRKDGDSIPLAEFPRRPFTAQAHAVKALVRLLGGPTATKLQRRSKAAILLGEIGSGKSTVALMTGSTIGAKRMLILCPPHLLTSWTNEIGAVLPDADVRVIQTVTDVDDIQQIPKDRTVIAILSRETAKLGHAWKGVEGVCPHCGHLLSTSADEAAKRRLYCDGRSLVASSKLAEAVVQFAYTLLPVAGEDHTVRTVLRGRFDQLRIKHHSSGSRGENELPRWGSDHDVWVDETLDHLIGYYKSREGDRQRVEAAIRDFLMAFPSDDRISRAILKITGENWHRYDDGASFGRDLLQLLEPGGSVQNALVEKLKSTMNTEYYGGYGSSGPFANWDETVTSLKDGKTIGYNSKVQWISGKLFNGEAMAGTRHALLACLATMASVANHHFRWGPVCGYPLFQAIPEPRRIPLAKHITKKHPRLFDFLVLDEGHEYATDGSAQERSAHRLTGLGLPTVLMTGSIMNGYAESLFTNMWALSADFRTEFDRDERQRFVDRYGYRKRLVEEKDAKPAEVIGYGSVTDRVERSERVIGNAPGVLPLFLLRHLLPISVTLHKSDLAIDLPPCRQSKSAVEGSEELLLRYRTLERLLVDQIRKDQFDPELAGRLWGQLAELPSYLDRATADTGNCDDGAYEIRYPESCGGNLVARIEPFPADMILPKEEWMLDYVESQLQKGRNVMVFSWHVSTLPRLARLIKDRIGEPVPVLYADKVSTGKRQDWIDREVVKKGRRVLVTNPVAIQTGLNNLVHFASEVWMENPACNPIIYRQAIGRVDRIGQTKSTDIQFPFYHGTLQAQLYDLLLRKVAVSVSTDGLDPESALAAAGVIEDEYLTGLSIGKQLYAMYQEGIIPEPMVPKAAQKAARTPPKKKDVLDLFDELAAENE